MSTFYLFVLNSSLVFFFLWPHLSFAVVLLGRGPAVRQRGFPKNTTWHFSHEKLNRAADRCLFQTHKANCHQGNRLIHFLLFFPRYLSSCLCLVFLSCPSAFLIFIWNTMFFPLILHNSLLWQNNVLEICLLCHNKNIYIASDWLITYLVNKKRFSVSAAASPRYRNISF